MAGVGGAFLSTAQLAGFVENMVSGRGFIAIACVVFARWNPVGVMGVALAWNWWTLRRSDCKHFIQRFLSGLCAVTLSSGAYRLSGRRPHSSACGLGPSLSEGLRSSPRMRRRRDTLYRASSKDGEQSVQHGEWTKHGGHAARFLFATVSRPSRTAAFVTATR